MFSGKVEALSTVRGGWINKGDIITFEDGYLVRCNDTHINLAQEDRHQYKTFEEYQKICLAKLRLIQDDNTQEGLMKKLGFGDK